MPAQRTRFTHVDFDGRESVYGEGWVICPGCFTHQEIIQGNGGLMIVNHPKLAAKQQRCSGSHRPVQAQMG